MTEGVCAIGSLTATSSPDRFVGQVMLTGARGQVLLEIDEVDMVVLRAPREPGMSSPAAVRAGMGTGGSRPADR